ncbi:MAG: sialic acid transporter permease protein SiaT [Firmicutes bacterium]|nr:sialic acid transporter permease protein SiaT [Bacillota bacterium]
MANTLPVAGGETTGHLPAGPLPRKGWLEAGLDIVLNVSLLCELAVLFGNIVARVLFHTSLLWSGEIAQLVLTILAFVGGALAFQRGQHQAVQAVVQRMSQRWQTVCAVLANWLVCALALLAGALTIPLMQTRWHTYTPVLQMSQGWFILPMTIGMAVLAYFALARLWQQPRGTVLAIGIGVLAAFLILLYAHGQWGPWNQGSGILWVSLALGVVLLVIGLPIGFTLPIAAFLYVYGMGAASPKVVPQTMQSGVNSFVLLAIPFFVLAGYLMTEGGLSQPLAEFVQSLVGHLRGGLLQVIIVTTYIFSGISGSKLADVAAVGTTLKGVLEKEGYKPAESVSVLAAAAVMGETVPPSIAMLVLGSVTTVSMGALFVAGILPAVVMAICLMVLVWVRAYIEGRKPGPRVPFRQRGRLTLKALPALLVPVILVGGILTGIATPTEVSSFAVLYALVVAVIFYRKINLRKFWKVLCDTSAMTGMILFIVSSGNAFSWALTRANLPAKIAEGLKAAGGSSWLFLLLTVITLVFMGAALEGLPALLIFGPLLMPVAQQFGIDLLQYGIVLILAMGLGSFCPPIGIGLYVACSIGGATMEETTRHIWPYILVLLIGVLLVAFVPWFSLVLPHLAHLGG